MSCCGVGGGKETMVLCYVHIGVIWLMPKLVTGLKEYQGALGSGCWLPISRVSGPFPVVSRKLACSLLM
jgi:hypothetical protein